MKKGIKKYGILLMLSLIMTTGCGQKNEAVSQLEGDNFKDVELVQYEDRTSNKKAVNFESQFIEVDGENSVLVLYAKSEDGSVVWKAELGTYPYGVDLVSVDYFEGDTYLYVNTKKGYEARDKQTGKTVWENTDEISQDICQLGILESKDKVFVINGFGADCSIEVYSIKDGTHLKTIANPVFKGFKEYSIYEILMDFKKVNEKLVLTVSNSSDGSLIGELTINSYDYSIKLDR